MKDRYFYLFTGGIELGKGLIIHYKPKGKNTMTWESIGSVDTGNIENDQNWIMFCLKLAKQYIEFVCGQAPDGSKVDVMWHDGGMGSYPSLGVWYEYSNLGNYVGDCERAMDAFNDGVDWDKLKEHYEDHIFQEDDDLDDEID